MVGAQLNGSQQYYHHQHQSGEGRDMFDAVHQHPTMRRFPHRRP